MTGMIDTFLNEEQYPAFRQAVLKKLELYAYAGFARELIDNIHVREDLSERCGQDLWLTLRAHIYGEKMAELTQTVELPVPEGRWALFLWSITPNRWRPWLKKKLGIRHWRKRVGFEQYRVFPQFVPAPRQFGGGRTAVVYVPVIENESWRA